MMMQQKKAYLYMSVSQSCAMLSVPSLRSPVIVKLLSKPDKANPFSTTSEPFASYIFPLLVVRVPAAFSWSSQALQLHKWWRPSDR